MSNSFPNPVIDLIKDGNAKAFSAGTIVHQTEFAKVEEIVSTRIYNIYKDINENVKKNLYNSYEVKQDAITILGGRGSGKTSFLLSIRDHYAKKENGADIEVIDLIDPTMIEDKGHIFLTIISLIANKVDKKLESISTNDNHYYDNKAWKLQLKKLAAGIPTLDDVGGRFEQWQEPEYIMDRGLKSVNAAFNLSKDFHEFVKYALKVLDKKAFILMLDDIDINFSKGWPVLETIRKYLTTPFIITFISGDIQLLSKAVRKKQWSNFGKALLKNEFEELRRKSQFDSLVTEMESQYMQKVLKPQYRITLHSLAEIYKTAGSDFKLGIRENGASISEDIKEYYKTILNDLGINNSTQLVVYVDFLLSLPLRTQIQLIVKHKESKEYGIAGLLNVFESDLYVKEINIDYAISRPSFLNIEILNTLTDNKMLEMSSQLQPNGRDASMNSCMMALTILFSHLSKENPFVIFDYIVRVGYMHNLINDFGYDFRYYKDDETTNIHSLISSSKLLYDRKLHDSLCSATAYIRVEEKAGAVAPYAGTFCLMGLASKAKGRRDDLKNRLDEAFSDAPDAERLIAFIPACIAASNRRQNTMLVYSVYTLLAGISDILRLASECDSDKNEISKLVGLISQIREYTISSSNSDAYRDNSDYYSEDSNTEKNDNSKSDRQDNDKFDSTRDSDNASEKLEYDLSDLIIKWIGEYKKYKKNAVPPHLVVKLSTRFFYAISNIGEEKFDSLGEYMHRSMVAIMNSILIEDVRENIQNDIELSNNNPLKKDDIFIQNLRKATAAVAGTEALSLSKWLLSSPLLCAYLDLFSPMGDDLNTALAKFLLRDKFKKSEQPFIYDKLCEVDLQLPVSLAALPKFSGGAGLGIQTTIDVLRKTHIPCSDFTLLKDSDGVKLKMKLKRYFRAPINKTSIKKISNYLNKNPSLKW